MKFVDYVKINLRSGGGGNGCSSLRREKFVPRGGPDGGDGGKGGDIYFQGARDKTTLLDFHFRRHFKAQRGGHGKGKDQHGKTGASLALPVPLGTLVKDAESGEVLLEIMDQRPRLILRGGAGGKGNARFKTSTNPAPMTCEEGHPGEERWVELELKLIADVGLVGFPNAGKSTLISRISKARPKIADYPFTTLTPNLGVVQTEGFESFVVADIPGIIRGAHEGAGLGHRFLRHIERTRLLLIMLDTSEQAQGDPMSQYETILEELALYSAPLMEKPRAVALTKMDLHATGEPTAATAQKLREAGERVLAISAVSGQGIPDLIRFLAAELARVRRSDAGSAPQRYASESNPDSSDAPPGPASSDNGVTETP